ncbi:MAG: hypothetical protein JWN70_3940 [Planctomycetaceae bacterium]|nr:hypothetical protein [Planctomycetaceae bacterium]
MTVSRGQNGFLSSMSERHNESESQTPFRERSRMYPADLDEISRQPGRNRSCGVPGIAQCEIRRATRIGAKRVC